MMIRNYLLVCLFGISACILAGTVAREAIDGGTVVTRDDQFPYQVSLRVYANYHACGGGLINDRHILTAAHCVVNDGQFIDLRMSVFAGTHVFSVHPPAVIAQVKKVFVPEEYFRSIHDDFVADIAVLKLANPVVLTHIRSMENWTLRLPPPSRNDTDKIALIAGWGYDQRLRYAKARVLGHQQCQRMHHPYQVDESAIMCAKVKHKIGSALRGVCNGDEGGPLVIDNYVIGILSKVAPHCDEMPSSAIYTRVSHFLPLIISAVSDERRYNIRTHLLPAD